MTATSIYKDILAKIDLGKFPEGCKFPDADSDELNYEPGALDGLFHYHTMSGFGTDNKRLMIKAIKAGASGDYEKGEECIRELSEHNRVITYCEYIVEYIVKHHFRLNDMKLYGFAKHLILNSDFPEAVKFGLTILRAFFTDDQQIREIVRTLGSYEEFTYFAAKLIKAGDNGNEELFRLAKRVHGWGRIHAVELLECTNGKIRNWLISEGINNTVHPSYSAITVWKKANCEELVYDENISYEQFHAVGNILAALVADGPVTAIDAVKNSEEIFLEYVKRSYDFELQVEDFENFDTIGQYLGRGFEEDGFEPCEAVVRIAHILNSPETEKTIREAARHGKGLHIASNLEIDVSEEFYECLCNDFENAAYDIGYLFMNPDYIDKALDEARKYYNPGTVKGELTTEMESDNEINLLRMLCELNGYPLYGMDIVKSCLFAPTVNIRNFALDTIREWVVNSDEQLSELSEELFHAVEKLRAIEPYEEHFDLIDKLLNGEVTDEEEGRDNEDD